MRDTTKRTCVPLNENDLSGWSQMSQCFVILISVSVFLQFWYQSFRHQNKKMGPILEKAFAPLSSTTMWCSKKHSVAYMVCSLSNTLRWNELAQSNSISFVTKCEFEPMFPNSHPTLSKGFSAFFFSGQTDLYGFLYVFAHLFWMNLPGFVVLFIQLLSLITNCPSFSILIAIRGRGADNWLHLLALTTGPGKFFSNFNHCGLYSHNRLVNFLWHTNVSWDTNSTSFENCCSS